MPSQARLTCRLVLASVAVLAVALAVARAPISAEDASTTILYPGWNLVGWIHEDRAVAELFEELPQLESIHQLDGLSAIRNTAEDKRGLQLLRFGVGYWFRVSGTEQVIWTRDAPPARRFFEMGAGHNAVAWTGGNNIPIGDALVGLQPHLAIAWRWDPSQQEFKAWAPDVYAPYRDGLPVNRGDAFILQLKRATPWLHPSGRLPEIEFPGGLDHDYLERDFELIVKNDLIHTVALFTGHGRVEIDPSHFVVKIPTTSQTRSGLLKDSDAAGAALRGAPTTGGSPHVIVIPWETWDETLGREYESELYAFGRHVMTHEYFHLVQFEFTTPNRPFVPNWLVEGTTVWDRFGRPFPVIDQQTAARSNLLDLSLYDQGGLVSPGSYRQDTIAIPYLLELTDLDSLLNFWRILGSDEPR